MQKICKMYISYCNIFSPPSGTKKMIRLTSANLTKLQAHIYVRSSVAKELDISMSTIAFFTNTISTSVPTLSSYFSLSDDFGTVIDV